MCSSDLGAIEDGNVKSVSDGFRAHPGFGAALWVCTVCECAPFLRSSSNVVMASFLTWALLASFLGVLFYPNDLPNAHFFYAGVLFVSSYLLSALRWFEGRMPGVSLAAVTLALVVLIAVTFSTKPAVGIAEVVYVVLTLSAWNGRT